MLLVMLYHPLGVSRNSIIEFLVTIPDKGLGSTVRYKLYPIMKVVMSGRHTTPQANNK